MNPTPTHYNFGGYATRNDIRCSDGRTIRKDAFKDCDGMIVPIVYQHNHSSIENVLGHGLLENRDDGVYVYGSFNDTAMGKNAKSLVEHGDIKSLSIYANQLKEKSKNVLHGMIREVSLVLSGANPGAYIDTIAFGHSDDEDIEDGEAIIFSGEDILLHADDSDEEDDKMADQANRQQNGEETVQDVWDSLSDKQKNVVYFMIGEALKNRDADDEEDDEDVKHNAFDNSDFISSPILTEDDYRRIFADAKRLGSLKESVIAHMEEDDGVLAHAIDTTGMTVSQDNQNYFVNDPSFLFPQAKALNNPPEWIKRNTEWVNTVMSGVHHTPFSRIKSVFANITEDEARAKGYLKGHMKKEEVFSMLKRETTPQTIYKKQKMDRDDVIDITDFDVIAWIKSEMRIMLDEEIARAILIGDGRLTTDDDHISEDHVRPIVNDLPLFTIKMDVTGGTVEEVAKNMRKAAVRARKDYQGSGNPTLFTTEEWLTEQLLLEDGFSHPLYKSEAEVATAFRVRNIVTVPVMENKKVDNKDLLGVIVNLADYNVGADKGGAVAMFDDFDIDYNQQKYLIETRISGALTKPYSAIVLLKTTAASGGTSSTNS